MCSTKVVAACIFDELQAAGLFLALDGTSTRTDPSTSGRKYHKLGNNAVFIRNESLFIVSAAATSAFQLKHTSWLLRSICPAGYQIQTIRYGKILVMLLYGKYYWRVYEVYNKYIYSWNQRSLLQAEQYDDNNNGKTIRRLQPWLPALIMSPHSQM